MAVVYLARQTDLDRDVALKELSAFHAVDPAFAERFLRESRVAGSLAHPNIVTVHEYFEHAGIPYIAMEYLERGSLRAHAHRLSLAQVAGVMEGVLAGLAHAHAKDIIHRDLKPENLLLTSQGGIKIADFGIAKALNRAQTGRFLTATGSTVGTPTYMAPEQALGTGIGPWTDLYSVGIMAYEMLLGRAPFAETETPMALMLRHVTEGVPPPLTVKPDLDPRLAAWLDSMLARDPAARVQSAEAAWNAFEDIVFALVGAFWRREARLLDFDREISTPKPLTPAPFHEDSLLQPPPDATPEEPAFQTFRPAGPEAPKLEPPRVDPPAFQPQAPAGPDRPAEHPPLEEAARGIDFQTFQPRRAAPPPQAAGPTPEPLPTPDPPATVPTPEPVLELPEAVEPPEALETIPPISTTGERSFEWPVAEPVRVLRSRKTWIAAVVVLVAGAVAGVLLLGGGKKQQAAPPTPAAGTVIPAATADLALAGSSIYLTAPNGRVVRLSRTTLRPAAGANDPAGPRSVVLGGGRVYVADGKTLSVLRPDTLAPVGASALGGAVLLAGGTDGPVAVVSRSGRGSICIASGTRLGACAALGFAPTGLGAGGNQLFAANGAAGTIVPFAVKRGRPVRQAPIVLGPASHPHGRLATFAGRLYVATDHGVTVVDPAHRKVIDRIHLPATPATLWIAPYNGRLFLPLYAIDKLAVLDAAFPQRPPVLVRSGDRPVAVAGPVRAAGARNLVYVANAGGTVTRHDALTGAQVGRPTEVAALTAKALPPTTATAVRIAKRGRTVTARLVLAGGGLDRHALVPRDTAIADGTAVLELWQGGIASRARTVSASGVSVRIRPLPGRLVVSVGAKNGAFTRMSASVAGKSVVLTFTQPPPAPKPTPTPAPAPQQQAPRAVTPAPAPAPAPTPAPPAAKKKPVPHYKILPPPPGN